MTRVNDMLGTRHHFFQSTSNENSSSSHLLNRQERSRRFLRVNLSLQTEYQQNREPLAD